MEENKDMKKTTYTTTRFDLNDDFYVEVSPNGEMIEFILCMKNYGLKSFIVGYYKKDCPEENWENIILLEHKNAINHFMDDIYDVFESGFLDEHGFFDSK